MGAIVSHAADLALPEDLVASAQRVDKDASDALAGDSDWLLKGVLSEAQSFMHDLQQRKTELLGSGKSGAKEEGWGAVLKAHPELMVKSLRAKAQRIIGHLETEKTFDAPDRKEHDKVLAALRAAAGNGNATTTTQKDEVKVGDVKAATKEAEALEQALSGAHDFLAKRAERLTKEEAAIQKDLEKSQVMQLFYLLKKRKSLPLASQVALLRRPIWKNCTFAATMLKEWDEAKEAHKPLPTLPFYKRLEQLALKAGLPVEPPKESKADSGGVLPVPGSDGRVYVVSSKLKNNVKQMADNLERMKKPLEQFVAEHGSDASDAADVKQAKEIMKGIDDAAGAVHGTHDFKTQMEAMNAMGDKLAAWAKEAEEREAKKGGKGAAGEHSKKTLKLVAAKKK